MKTYADPDKNVNLWLRSLLLDALNQRDKNADLILSVAIDKLTNIADPGMIEESFELWIQRYRELLAEHCSTQSNARQHSSHEDPQVVSV